MHRKIQNRSALENLTLLPDHYGMNPEEKYRNEEFEKAVREAVRRLPEKRRIIWLMHREDKLTYQEIADILEISIKTVETQMCRSLKFLRTELVEFLPVFVGILAMLNRL